MDFRTYLLAKGEALNTVRMRENTALDFENWNAKKVADYQTMIDYVNYCKSKGNTTHTIRLKIKSLDHYFEFLVKQKRATENPAKLLKMQGGTKKIPHKLLDQEELKTIYEHQETYGLVQKRNKVLLSLVVFQAVGSMELEKIELKDVDLVNGKIYIPGTRASNSRTLELKVQQLLLFQDYITNTRREILKEANKTSDLLLVNQGQGKGILSNVISILIRNLHRLYPKLTSLQQVRQSVVTQWIKEHGLRKAQYMAGHRYVSSTERYNEDRLEGLKKELKMHYVMK